MRTLRVSALTTGVTYHITIIIHHDMNRRIYILLLGGVFSWSLTYLTIHQASDLTDITTTHPIHQCKRHNSNSTLGTTNYYSKHLRNVETRDSNISVREVIAGYEFDISKIQAYTSDDDVCGHNIIAVQS